MIPINRLSIQSKLVVILLGVSVGSILVISFIGYTNGKKGLTDSAYNHLTGTLTIKANLLRSEFHNLRKEVLTLADTARVLTGVKAFRSAFKEIEKREVPAGYDAKLAAFYRDVFFPLLTPSLESEPLLESYMPQSVAARYLQYQYIAMNPHPYLKKYAFAAAEDGSAYDEAHKLYHPFFAKLAAVFGFEDILIVDGDSLDVVYSFQKTTSFATNLESGPYARSNLASLVRSLQKSMDPGDLEVVDFEPYRPNLGQPCAFVAAPIFDGPRGVGFLVVKFPVNEINRVMTGDDQWEKEGLGRTGEVLLIGSDFLIRSQSRFMTQDFPGLIAALEKHGVAPGRLERIKQQKMLILNADYRTTAVEQALQGKQGIRIEDDYRGIPVLCSYAPLDVEGLRWAIVAKMDLAEAVEPVAKYGRSVLTSSVAIILLVTLLASALAHLFVRPIHKLSKGARRIGAGQTDVVVEVHSRDEFGDLADAFNEMTRNLRAQGELITEKVRENEELLLNILPGPVAARMRSGDTQAAQTFANVTVLFANITGFTELSDSLSAEKAVGLLNDLIVAFDDAAERQGVERFKTIGCSYMAVCGLSVQRPDQSHRTVELALELSRVLRRFSQERGVNLGLEVGINAGPVVGGVVGRTKYIYDLWGDTVDIARGIKPSAGSPTILVTQTVYERVRNMFEFESAGTVQVRGKEEMPIWSVKASGPVPTLAKG